jgi:protein TonB
MAEQPTPGRPAPSRLTEEERRRYELELAEQRLSRDPATRRTVARALAAALVLHATVLIARMPDWGEPKRVDAPIEEAMQVKFLRPPPPPPKAPPKPPEPVTKKIPKPDPTPEKPEPIKEPPPPPPQPDPEPTPAPPAPPQQQGPVRVAPGQGPGLIKKVEPRYPPIAQTARLEGSVTVDAIIRADGTVSDVKVLKSTNAMFDQACIDAVRQWRFTPGNQDVILTVTVNFTLR